jgi:hypothetical protein
VSLPPDAELLARTIAHHLRHDLAELRETRPKWALDRDLPARLEFTFDERAALLRAAAVLEAKVK